MLQVPGFDDPSQSSGVDNDTLEGVKTIKKRGGGFQSMNLSHDLLKGITKRGYKIPTPIQRKTIPLVLEGRDVVAMARTGSGKTACFLIPLFEKLKLRIAKSGARAIILSPTRELALQTLKFFKEIGRFSDLKAAVILGGDSMENQFSIIHGNPDVLIATPGRFFHLCVEMDLKLNAVEYVVFDEADRLFEMGFGEQLKGILEKLPDTRQTLLFSATLPKGLVEFAKAGLNDPTLIRLDVETKIPEELQLYFLTVRQEQLPAALIVLLKSHIEKEQQTVVFAATKHHVEYLHLLLELSGISNTYIYSNLDPSARKINAAKFKQNKVSVLVVTDVAARGLDIPSLDNVINYNFPPKSKLFVHRVGRCARAGRSGSAYSLVTPDEYPFVVDLHLFLGRPLHLVQPGKSVGNIGCMPQDLVEEQYHSVLNLHAVDYNLGNLKKTMDNGYMHYLRTRPLASVESNRRVKEIQFNNCGIHPLFDTKLTEKHREEFMDRMNKYRPQGTIFEICGKNKSQDYVSMKQKRAMHKDIITNYRNKKKQQEKEKVEEEIAADQAHFVQEESNETDIKDAFGEIMLPKKRKIDNLYRRDNKRQKIQDDNYIPYLASDRHTEEHLAVNNFDRDANKYELDLTHDSTKSNIQKMKWDRKKKKMVAVNNSKVGKIQTESGNWIAGTYKSKRYEEWKQRSKVNATGSDDENESSSHKDGFKRPLHTQWAKHNEKMRNKKVRSELKNTDQIVKQRKLLEKKKARHNNKKKGKKSNKKKH